jgi:hypothetical protein
MSKELMDRIRAGTIALGPLFLMAAMFYHPYIADLTDESQVAGAMSTHVRTARWGLSHLAVAAGLGLLLLAMLAVRTHLREAGEHRWSAVAVPFLVMGTIVFTFLPAMEIAMIGAFDAGTDPVALQANLSTWFVPLMVTSAVLSGVGTVLLAAGIVRSGVLAAPQARIVAGALAVLAVSRFVPQGRALYVGAVAAVVALVPIAIRMWNEIPAAGRTRSGIATSPGTVR